MSMRKRNIKRAQAQTALHEVAAMRKGDNFTIAEVGPDKNGELVFNGHTKDGRKSNAVSLKVWTIKEVL